MKKLSTLIITIFLIVLSIFPALAEGKLEQFEEMINGEWEQIPSCDNGRFGRFYAVKHFIYPAPIEKYDLDDDKTNDDYIDVIYESYLTQSGNGNVYLHFLINNEDLLTGNISFSSDGTILYIEDKDVQRHNIYIKVK